MKKRFVQLMLLMAIVLGATLAFEHRGDLSADSLQVWLGTFGSAAPWVFMALYAVATVLFMPGAVVTLVGGVLFGPVWGTLYNLTGATLGAAVAFLIARYLAGDWVERRSRGRMEQLKQGVESEGWRFVAFVRLVPLFPFNILNYALGLTRIRFSHYVITTYVAMLPGAMAYTYLGYVGREAVGGGQDMVQKVFLAVSLLAAVALLPGLIRRLRQGPMLEVEQLHERLSGESAPVVLDVREPQEFNGDLGHIDSAINIPLDRLEQRLDELTESREQPIAIVCHTDRRSAKAARILAGKGFADVRVVRKGMTGWNKAGLAVVKH